jgi:thymidine kinase
MANTPSISGQLAKMINKGFKITATKEDVAAWRSEINEKFEAVESRLGRIEHVFVEEQRRQIEHLETRKQTLEDALAI